jgi:hypothetical protein
MRLHQLYVYVATLIRQLHTIGSSDPEALRVYFDGVDVDTDGVITADEFRVSLATLVRCPATVAFF